MRRVKVSVLAVMLAALVLPMLLALPGCIWVGHDRDHHDRGWHEDHHDERHDDHR